MRYFPLDAFSCSEYLSCTMKVLDLINLLEGMSDRADVFFVLTDIHGEEQVVTVESCVEKEDGTVVLQ